MLSGHMVGSIRAAAERIAAEKTYIRIDDAKLIALAVSLKDRPIPAWDNGLHFFDGGPKSVMYTLLLDAVNFCFWPSVFVTEYQGKRYGLEDGYCALSVALKRAFEEGIPLWDPTFLTQIDVKTLKNILRFDGDICLLEERAANARNLGETLVKKYHGDPSTLLAEAGHDAARLADLLAADFDCYRDERVWRGETFAVMKRAQICASDLAGSFNAGGVVRLTGAEKLTCFADYKLPQLFHADGVFVYSADVEKRILAQELIPENSEEEVAIRANTILVVERLKKEIAALGREISAREIDWLLWDESITPGRLNVPHHRTLTTAY